MHHRWVSLERPNDIVLSAIRGSINVGLLRPNGTTDKSLVPGKVSSIAIFSCPGAYVAVARVADRVFETDAADGAIDDLLDSHCHAFPDAGGLSQRAAIAADEIRAGAGDRQTDGSLQGHAGVLRRSGGVCGGGDSGVSRPDPMVSLVGIAQRNPPSI
jgi:hypothetical protein